MSQDLIRAVAATVRDVPDFPKPGILFKDITPVLSSPAIFGQVISWMSERCGAVDAIVGMESRGFIFAAPVALARQAAFVPARKPGKLPADCASVSYDLEYGSATLEIHRDAIRPGTKVVVVDDVLATGGTAAATVELVRKLGGEVVSCIFLIELDFLDGRARLDVPVHSLLHY